MFKIGLGIQYMIGFLFSGWRFEGNYPQLREVPFEQGCEGLFFNMASYSICIKILVNEWILWLYYYHIVWTGACAKCTVGEQYR